MEMTNWKTVHKQESYGDKSYGIEIRVAIDRPLNDNDQRAMYKIADQIEQAIMTETMAQDTEAQTKRKLERDQLLEVFGHTAVYVEEIPNGYCSRWCCTQSPWFIVTTPKGRITIGWRKSVINISWEPQVNDKAEVLFADERPTKFDRTIHAYGYEKAKQYVSRLLI